MAERLGDIEARLASVKQLSAVIAAMRGIAAARVREAQGRLDGVRVYAKTVGEAIGQALALLPPDGAAGGTGATAAGHLVICLCAEQGFAGAFNTHVLDAAIPLLGDDGILLLAGDRGVMAAGERGLAPAWTAPMVSHVDQAADLANRLAEALYARLDARHATHVSLIHALPGPSEPMEVVVQALIPFDFSRFPVATKSAPPLTNLPPAGLLARLAEEYVFAELCEAVLLSFAAENEARMRAMIAARQNVADKQQDLTSLARRLRQEQITAEVIELAGAS